MVEKYHVTDYGDLQTTDTHPLVPTRYVCIMVIETVENTFREGLWISR